MNMVAAIANLLLLLLGLGFLLGGFLTLADQLGLIAGVSQRAVGVEGLHLLSDSTESDGGGGLGGSDDLTLELGSVGDLLGGGITLLGSTLAGEDNQASFIFLQALGVQLQGLNALVGASVIYGNTNGLGEDLVDAGLLELLQSEATSGSLLEVIFLRRALHKRSEVSIDRARSVLSSFNASLLPADLLLDRLVEPGLHSGVPVLVEVLVGDHCNPKNN